MAEVRIEKISYQTENVFFLDDITYDFPENKMIGIISPADQQTSYLLKIIGGIREPSSGKVFIDSKDIFNEKDNVIRELRKRISFVFERGGLIANLSIQENFLLPLDFHFPELSKAEKIEKVLKFFKLFELKEHVLSERPARIHPYVYKLVLLIRALVLEPEVLLLDNPFVDLEFRHRKILLQYLLSLRNSDRVTIICITNSDILLEYADICLVVANRGIIESSTWIELIQSENDVTREIIRDLIEVSINETKI